MIRVPNPIPEPAEFDEECRQKGRFWLQEHPDSEQFPSYWIAYQPQLAEGFHERCGWWAMRLADGQVDHFLSKNHHRDLAYEWSNYRYIAGTVNASKKALDDQVLDPFEIEDDWFEVHLPSMQLVMTDRIPEEFRSKAKLTVEKLHLANGRKVRRIRKRWYDDYKEQKVTLEGLRLMAPLVATAVEKHLADSISIP